MHFCICKGRHCLFIFLILYFCMPQEDLTLLAVLLTSFQDKICEGSVSYALIWRRLKVLDWDNFLVIYLLKYCKSFQWCWIKLFFHLVLILYSLGLHVGENLANCALLNAELVLDDIILPESFQFSRLLQGRQRDSSCTQPLVLRKHATKYLQMRVTE